MLIKLTILNKKTLLHLNYIAFLPEGNIYAINKTRSNANKENKWRFMYNLQKDCNHLIKSI